MQLEENRYSRMFITNVNSYIAEYEKTGKLKRKKDYAYGDDLEWSQNFSSQIIAKTIEATLIRGADIEQTIRQHPDLMDFMLRTNVPRKGHLLWGTKQVQNTSRYFISNIGEELTKVLPPLAKSKTTEPRRFGINKGFKTTICNNLSDLTHFDVNYDWYIAETKKLIDPLRKA